MAGVAQLVALLTRDMEQSQFAAEDPLPGLVAVSDTHTHVDTRTDTQCSAVGRHACVARPGRVPTSRSSTS